MAVEPEVANHYTTGGLFERIKAALKANDVDPEKATPDDLKPVDEFHIGGVAATRDLLGQIKVTPSMHLLDIGSGIGGASRFVKGATGCTVTGLDLTPEFVETATALSRMVGLDKGTSFQTGSALDMPFANDSFDAALLLHVGMNIPDKPRLMAEAGRVLKPGASFAVYEVMKTDLDEIDFPVPWANTPETSFLATLEEYQTAAEAAGFTVVATRNRREFALEFFAELRAQLDADIPPPLGLNLLMGETRVIKVKNMVSNISSGRIAPIEMILRAQ